MRVLHLGLETTTERVGGLNRYLEDLVAAQRELGLEASALVLGQRGLPTPPGVVAVAPPGSLARGAVAIALAARRAPRPDVVDLHFAGTSVLARSFGGLRAVPTVVHFQGPWADESALTGSGRANVAVKRRVERTVYRRADRVVCLSSAFRDVVVARYGVAPWDVDVLAPGVDLDAFSPGDAAAARAAVDAPRGRLALAVRRLVPRMGLEVLLESWLACDPTDADLLAVIGDGSEAGRLRALAASLGIEGTVRFCGRVDDDVLRQWYVAADVTVVPTVALEGFGLVVLESLACGTPVVGTDAGGLGEALVTLGQAAPVAIGDPASLAIALKGALSAPKDAATSARARAAAEAHSWRAVAERHRTLYEHLGDAGVVRVVVLDHTAVLSGGELAIARAVGGLGGAARVHAILGADGPLVGRLLAAGTTTEVLELDPATQSLPRSRVRGGGVSPRTVVHTARYVVRLARRLRRLRPDVVHTNSLKAALYGGAAARLAGVPCVWHVRDRLEPPSLPRGAARLVHVAARVLPTAVVANSASTLATVGVRDGAVVPSPLDPSIAPPARRTSSGPTRFTVVGRLAPWKGQRLAVEAFARAFGDSDETLRLVGAAMFGEDAYATSLAALVDAHGLGGRVELAGFVEDVASVLADTDVLVHSSVEPEPFGQVVIEAMGAGCAVLVADAGGPAEVVTDGVDGLRYPMGDVGALADGMRRLAGDPALRARLGEAGVATASAYTPAALAPRLLAVWTTAAATRARRARRRRGG